jgi:hypothetical protein
MALITALRDKDDAEKSKSASRTIDDGPPPSTEKFKAVQATPTKSLFQQSTSDLATKNEAGLGPEGGSPQAIANQALSQVLTGIRTLSVVLPGLVPVLSDLTGRLQMIVPQMMSDLTNGGMGLVPSMGMPLPQPGQAPMGGPGMAGPGAGMMPPGMPPPPMPMGPGGPPQGMPPMSPTPPPGMMPPMPGMPM